MTSAAIGLLSLLGIASLLGMVLGYSISRLGEQSRVTALRDSLRAEQQASEHVFTSKIESLEASLAVAREQVAREKKQSKARDTAQRAKHEALEIHALAQKNRIDSLLTEQRVVKDRWKRSRRRVGDAPADSGPMVDPATQVPSSVKRHAASRDKQGDSLPVLNRRVEPSAASLNDTSSDLWADLALVAEEELPELTEFEDIADEA